MPPRPITITHADRQWHEPFLRFVPRIFPSLSFRRWYELGGWNERYVVFAWRDGDELVSSVSRMQMELVHEGARGRGWQLGTVGTLAEYRRQGLQRPLMTRLFESTPAGDPTLLFATETVLDFYPRFGFEPVREHIFRAAHPIEPNGEPLRTLRLESTADRTLLKQLAAAAEPVTQRLGAGDYGSIVLWYWCNLYPDAFRYSAEHDAILAVEQTGDVLLIRDVLPPKPFDLEAVLPRIASQPVRHIEFGFTPERIWPAAAPHREDTDNAMFLRGEKLRPASPFKFPLLAQT